VDVDRQTLNMDVSQLEVALTPRRGWCSPSTSSVTPRLHPTPGQELRCSQISPHCWIGKPRAILLATRS
jgi:dTDP-4-amino-4,6-dideoxygalactose transaminase